MVQEPAEAGFSSMPQNAIASGVADFFAPLARLAERLAKVAHSKGAVRSLDIDGSANDLRRVVAFLRARTGHDFSSYKRATVMRRVLRRMQVCRLDGSVSVWIFGARIAQALPFFATRFDRVGFRLKLIRDLSGNVLAPVRVSLHLIQRHHAARRVVTSRVHRDNPPARSQGIETAA